MAKSSPLRTLGWIVGAFVAILLIAVVVISVTLSPERLRSALVTRANEATGLPVRLDDARVSYSPPGIRLRGLEIGASGSIPHASLDSGLVELDLGPLLSRRLVVKRLELEGPEVVLAPSDAAPASASTRPREGAGTPPGAEFTTVIEQVRVTNGAFRWEAPGDSADFSLDGLDLTARVEVEAGGQVVRTDGDLSLAALNLPALEAWRETVERMEPRLAFALQWSEPEGAATFDALRLEASPLVVEAQGALRGLPDAPEIELAVAPRTYELSDLLPLIPSGAWPEGRSPRASGPVQVQAEVHGALGGTHPLAWEADVDLQGARLAMEGFPEEIEELRGTIAATADTIRVNDLTGRLDDRDVSLRGWISDPGLPLSRYDVALRGDADLATWTRTGLLPAGIRLAGNATFDLGARGVVADPATANLTGEVTLANGRYESDELRQPVTELNGRATLHGTDATLTDVSGRIGTSPFRGHGGVTDVLGAMQVSFDGTSSRLDLRELAPPVGTPETSNTGGTAPAASGTGTPSASPPLVPPLPLVPTRVRLAVDSLFTEGAVMTGVTMDADLRVDEGDVTAHFARAELATVTLERFDSELAIAGATANGTFRAPRVQAQNAPLTDVTGHFQVDEKSLLQVDDIAGSLWNGHVVGKARVDLSDRLDPAFEIESQATGLDANGMLSAMTPAKNLLHGSLDLSSSFSGRGATPEEVLAALTGQGNVKATSGRIEATPAVQRAWQALGLSERETIPFRDLVAPFSFREGRLVTDNLVVRAPDANWSVNGSVGVNGDLDYRATTELSEQLSDEMRRKAGRDLANLLAGSSGRLIVDLRIHGDAKAPKVDLDRTKLAQRIAENAKQNVQKELEKGKDKLIQQLFGSDSAAADTTKAPKLDDALKGLLKRK
ncbi:MAG: AsmA-like C-terminal region-containing protein [bacterium]